MTDPRHARILARIAKQVVEQYTTTRSGSTTDPDMGNVPIPDRGLPVGHPHPSWNYTLPEEYRG